MKNRPAVISPTWWIVAIVVIAIVVGTVALLRIDRSGNRGDGLSERFDYEIEPYRKIDPALVQYEQRGEIPTAMQEARAVAVGPEDGIYVAGDEALHVFDPAGSLHARIALDGKPTCLAVGGPEHAFPGRVYVGVGRAVETFDAELAPAGTWEVPGDKAHLTSIALATGDVFVADFASRVVLRYNASGKLLARIGKRDKDRGIPGLVIPSPFFDVAVGPDGHLWVANSGARRLEAYTFEGRLELFWGKSSPNIEGFFGCCNPANFAILPDGSFVTAEKGLLRVKVYTADGQFDAVVAGPEELDAPAGPGTSPRAEGRFDHEFKAVDIAADSRGRVLILDPARASVRIYEREHPASEANEGPSRQPSEDASEEPSEKPSKEPSDAVQP